MTTSIRTLRIPCADQQQAIDCKNALRGQEVDVERVDGRFVLVPAGWSALFVWDLAEAVQDYCVDAELARWATREAQAAIDTMAAGRG